MDDKLTVLPYNGDLYIVESQYLLGGSWFNKDTVDHKHDK